ncbi:MAG: LysR family transcriptional regulator [Pirellulales bacterium]
MQLRNLKVFCDVVARHSFSKAAEDNGMTQSGASQAVQQLEDYLKVQLLDRSKRPFVLTAEGNLFYAGCGKIVRQFENLAEEVRSLGQEISGRATIAAIYSVGLSYLPELQKLMKLRYPQAELRFQFGHPDEVYRSVEQGTADFGLVSYPQQSKTIQATHWREEPMVLAAPAGHPLSARARVTPEDLGLESLIAFAPNLRIRHEIDRYLRSIGITMQIAAELDNIDSVKHALEINSGVAFLPRPAIASEIASGSVVALPCDWLSMQRPLGVIERRDTSLGRTARAFYELLFEVSAIDDAQVARTTALNGSTEERVQPDRVLKYPIDGASDGHSRGLARVAESAELVADRNQQNAIGGNQNETEFRSAAPADEPAAESKRGSKSSNKRNKSKSV